MREGFCTECGLQLVFAAEPPDLGKCQKCSRKYTEDDLVRSFCPTCGEPVSISEDLRKDHVKQKEIASLFKVVPELQRYGYLPKTGEA